MSDFDRRRFLKGAAFASAVMAMRPSLAIGGVNPALEAVTTLPLLTFKRFHPSIASVSDPRQLEELVVLIKQYARPAIVSQHYLGNGAHGGFRDKEFLGFALPAGRGRDFFIWHRNYIHGLEEFLGTYQHKLLSWAPWELIPPAFVLPRERAGSITPPPPPVATMADFALWSHERIGCWKDVDAMGFYLSWGPHFAVHFKCGGDMAQLNKAPNAPLFWPWHTFLDDLYEDYLKSPACNWPRPPGRNAPGTVLTPWCLGVPFDAAVNLITSARLTVGERHGLSRGSDLVISQRPLQLSRQNTGTAVDLSGEVPPPFGSTRYPLV